MYNYKISVLKVIDGDTIDAEIDLGFNIKTKKRSWRKEKRFSSEKKSGRAFKRL